MNKPQYQIILKYSKLLSGTIGTLFSLNFVSPYLSPPHAKISFVSIWFAFAFALWLLNRKSDREVFQQIPSGEKKVYYYLVLNGFIGGIFTGIAGSGLDICSFCLLKMFQIKFLINFQFYNKTTFKNFAERYIFEYLRKLLHQLRLSSWDLFPWLVLHINISQYS